MSSSGAGGGQDARLRPGARSAFVILALLIVPAALSLRTVRDVRPMVPVLGDPSPLGYTWSLLFFWLPATFLGVWFHLHPRYRGARTPFWASLGVLFLCGAGLDIFLGTLFFTFPNRAATLGVMVPVVGGVVPIEEFAFYFGGFAAIILTYIWANHYWLAAYDPCAGQPQAPVPLGQILRFHWSSLVIGVGLFAAGLAYKKLGPHPWHEGFPGYYTFLLALAVVPSVVLFESVRAYINWEALTLTCVLMLLVHAYWEGVLAVPYQWWGYQDRQMVGIRLGAMSNLPIEEPILATVCTWAGVLYYKGFRLWLGDGQGQAPGPTPAERRP